MSIRVSFLMTDISFRGVVLLDGSDRERGGPDGSCV